MRLGAHESVAGGTWNAIALGREDGCEALQIFARPRVEWRTRPFAPDEVSLFRSELASVGWPTMSHGSYLINPCATDTTVLERSRDALTEELLRAEELGLDYVVIHPGAHMGCGEGAGVDGIAASLSEVHRRVPGLRVTLLLELTAGQGSCLGCRFDQFAAILDRTRGSDRLGICFDTCHAHAAGFDLLTDEGYQRVFEDFDRLLGLPLLRAFHLNDSKTPLGSRVDRHAEIGDGFLGRLPFWRLVNDARFARVPGVLETPSGPDKKPSFARNLARLRALIGAPRPDEPAPVQEARGRKASRVAESIETTD
ncbi:MAG TPA: deoxyribonuclease IV [Polyangia bacterium]|jgi:deoxyribonuclease-4|nr:deoxyribonuclease IV [Polyangia bacterium]